MSLLARIPPGYESERRWVLRAVFRDLLGGVPVEVEVEKDPSFAEASGSSVASGGPVGIELRLPDAADGRCLRIADGLFAVPEQDWLAPASLPAEPLRAWRVPPDLASEAVLADPEVPVLFGAPEEGGTLWRESAAGAWLGLDIFGGIFFCLSRYEEALPGPRDHHDRFPGAHSLAGRRGFLDRPLADEYAEVLWAALRRLWPGLRRPPQQFRLRLSHDVDQPLALVPGGPIRGLRRAGGDLLAGRGPAAAARTLGAATRALLGRGGNDPADTFDWILDLSETHGLQSAFYFIAGHTGPEEIDGTYRLEDPFVRDLLAKIHHRGHEIGLHPSYGTYRDGAALRSELETLKDAIRDLGSESPPAGGRMHYLRWHNPKTWQHWEDAGLAYDSTLGFADLPGFRCGTCHEYRTFNLQTRRELRLRERPLVVMEVTLRQYQKLGWERALEETLRLAAVCRRFGGDFTLLWHNNNLAGAAERRTYRRALEEIAGGR